jgi:hypothetical protein
MGYSIVKLDQRSEMQSKKLQHSYGPLASLEYPNNAINYRILLKVTKIVVHEATCVALIPSPSDQTYETK